MKLLVFFTVSLLVGLAYSGPISNRVSDDDNVTVTSEFFADSLVVYSGEHDIINMLVPLNTLNFEDDTDDDSDESENTNVVMFFAEGDIKDNGEIVEHGIYMLKNKNATKLLDNGLDFTAASDDSKTAYFATKDGIYVYNAEKNKAEKYGTLDDSIIGIAKYNGTDLIYILTKDKVLYKVTEEGTRKEKVEEVVNAQQIVTDYQNNLYFYTPDKKVYVFGADGVKSIEGLPENPSSLRLLRPPFIIEDGVPVIVDDKAYVAYVNGTSELTDFTLEAKPSAYAMEGAIIQYYGYNKKIYEYNILLMLLGDVLNELKGFLQGKADEIQNIATRSLHP